MQLHVPSFVWWRKWQLVAVVEVLAGSDGGDESFLRLCSHCGFDDENGLEWISLML